MIFINPVENYLIMTFNIPSIGAMVVCLCEGVSEKRVQRAIEQGASSRRQVTEACGAGGVCGGCHTTIVEMIRQCPRRRMAAASASSSPAEASSLAIGIA